MRATDGNDNRLGMSFYFSADHEPEEDREEKSLEMKAKRKEDDGGEEEEGSG